jgi:hypothetical protein
MKGRHGLLIDGAHLFFLSGCAFAQPIFDVLAQNSEFFVAHRSDPVDTIVLALILSFALPLLLIVLESITLFNQKLRRGIHLCFVAILFAVMVLLIAKRFEMVPAPALLALAGVGGSLAALFFSKLDFVSQPFTAKVLALASLGFPVVFLLNPQISRVVYQAQPTAVTETRIDSTSPLIVVVFDEFPTTSLMDQRRLIDPNLYPGFSELAGDGYWFRNATTVSDNTMVSVPSILTGRNPDVPRPATFNDYPNNLFTLFGESYDLKVFESVTRLCPENLCSETISRIPFRYRLELLLSDVSIVYLHLVLPGDLADRLPPVTDNWSHFNPRDPTKEAERASSQRSDADRRRQFLRFVESIRASERPTLYFLHVLLPHVPWSYLPSGKQYKNSVSIRVDGWLRASESWVDNEFVVNQAFQRHLLQVGFVDRLLGQLIEKLKAADLYEQSMILVTADHGVSFIAGQSRRNVTEETYQDILTVPLIVKRPFQRDPVTSDRNVETIDILPTIADALGVSIPWTTDGVSAFADGPARNTKKHLWPAEAGAREFVTGPLISKQYDTLRRKIGIFGAGPKQDGFLHFGPHGELIGKPIETVNVEDEKELSVLIHNAREFFDVREDQGYVPVRIAGELTGGGSSDGIKIGIGINGIVRAVVETFRDGAGIVRFSAFVSEAVVSEGDNRIDVVLIRESPGGDLRLSRIRQEAFSYSIVRGEAGEPLLARSDGASYRMVAGVMQLAIDSSRVLEDRVVISGWAADKSRLREPLAVLLFADGEFIDSVRADVPRPDVAKFLGAPAVQMTGYEFDVPLTAFSKAGTEGLRILALSRDGEAEGTASFRLAEGQ